MADRPTDGRPRFESPVTRVPRQFASPASEPVGLTLADNSEMAKMLVRAGPGTGAARQLGVPFGASRHRDGTLICGRGPDEWLLLGTGESVAVFAGSLDDTGHVSLIDHTHGLALLRLTGEVAPSVLEKVCSLDWGDEMTPDGAVVSASVAKITCDLIRDDVPGGGRSYLVACDRSYGQYLFDAVIDAGREFGLTGVA